MVFQLFEVPKIHHNHIRIYVRICEMEQQDPIKISQLSDM